MDVEVEHLHHHARTGHRLLDKVIPLSALLISIVSIGIAFHHGKVMQALVQQNERLVQANSLPYVELARSSGNLEGTMGPSLVAVNSGVGPAQIRSMQIKVDGRAVSNPDELFAACCGGRDKSKFGTSTLFNRMLPAGEELRYLFFVDVVENSELARSFRTAADRDRIVTTICYCSVFEECWTSTSAGMNRPQRVDSCALPEPQYRY